MERSFDIPAPTQSWPSSGTCVHVHAMCFCSSDVEIFKAAFRYVELSESGSGQLAGLKLHEQSLLLPPSTNKCIFKIFRESNFFDL